MGSLRNPIGPLPSSIYWRRRVVALAILALLTLLVVWALGLGGGERGGDGEGRRDNGQGPTDAITPGPSASDPPITERPGGRDEVDGGAGSGGGDGDQGGTGSGGGGDGGTEGAAGGGTGGKSGALAGSSGSLTGGDGIPAGPGTPACGPGGVTVTLKSVKNAYGPRDTPELELTVKNKGGSACRVDLGRTAAVVKITDSDDDRIWSSGDCPPDRASAYVQVPAGGETTHTLEWDRERSGPECGTPSAKRVPAGTYLAEARIKGLPTARTSFVLTKD